MSYIVTPPDMGANGLDGDNTASYTSDMFAMIGTLFLFLYWPSFSTYVVCDVTPARAHRSSHARSPPSPSLRWYADGGLLDATTNQEERALVNTVMSLAGTAQHEASCLFCAGGQT